MISLYMSLKLCWLIGYNYPWPHRSIIPNLRSSGYEFLILYTCNMWMFSIYENCDKFRSLDELSVCILLLKINRWCLIFPDMNESKYQLSFFIILQWIFCHSCILHLWIRWYFSFQFPKGFVWIIALFTIVCILPRIY